MNRKKSNNNHSKSQTGISLCENPHLLRLSRACGTLSLQIKLLVVPMKILQVIEYERN